MTVQNKKEMRTNKVNLSTIDKISKVKRNLFGGSTKSGDFLFEKHQKVVEEYFRRKYNFDIVNDKPLEGRFIWRKKIE